MRSDEEDGDAAADANDASASSPEEIERADAATAAAAVRSLRLRPRERSAEEIAAAAAAAASVPRSFQGPSLEKQLSNAAAPWLRVVGILLLVVAALAAGYFAGRHRDLFNEPPAESSPAGAADSRPASATSRVGGRDRATSPQLPSDTTSLLLRPVPSQSTPPPAPPAPSSTPSLATWSDAEFTSLDAALTAERAGDRTQAARLTAELRTQLGQSLSRQSAALDIYLAEIAIRDRRGSDAQALLFPLTRTATPSAQACDRLGFVHARNRNFSEAVPAFAQAAELEPLVGVYFYRWGESLRRLGKLPEAVKRLNEALLRQRGTDPLSAPLTTSLKYNLARIELGETAAVRAEAEEHIRGFPAGQPLPFDAGDWMLTAAACDLQENKLAAAVAWLRKARAALPAARFEEALTDYFFRDYTAKLELTSVLPTPAEMEARRLTLATRPDVYFIDP